MTPSRQLGLSLSGLKVGLQCLTLGWPSALKAQRPPRAPSPPGRLQHKLALLQQQCEEKQQLFQTLQSELQIYEALHSSSKKGPKGMRSPLTPPGRELPTPA